MKLVQWVGLMRLRRSVISGLVVSLLLSGAFAATVFPFNDEGSTRFRASSDIATAGEIVDTAGNGLPDVVENRIGSDPAKYATLGGGVADGWLYHWYGEAVPWNDTEFLDTPVLVAPPDALPEPLREKGAVDFPTIRQLFAFENETREAELWWLEGPSLDPSQWDNTGDGIADAWLLQYGIDPFSAEPDEPAPGDGRMTLQEKYEAGLDPTTRDTSGNGLGDAEALAGIALFDGEERVFEPTDPRAFSSRGDGIPDGYLVRFSLDPHDEDVADQDPAGDGLSVLEAYNVSAEHCERTQDPCVVSDLVREGLVVDPTSWDTIGDGIADAWALADPTGVAHPLVDGTSVVVFSTAEWDQESWNDDPGMLFGVVVDELNPPPETLHELTLHDLYAYQRPSVWNEETDGPWWDGIPTDLETPEGALPPAVALRGWKVQVDLCRGCNESRPAQEDDVATLTVQADPRNPDTSGDGLTDVEEYFGVHKESGKRFGRTNPGNPDTDGDGLTDHDEVEAWGTDPVRRDTSGSFLTDGEEVTYWSQRHADLLDLLESDTETAQERYGWLVDDPSTLSEDDAQRLHPLGSVHGETPNVLAEDADGDGIRDGAELSPNRYLDRPSSKERPSTDPARVDSDGDDLPDPWEIRWSQDIYFDCPNPCSPPPNADNTDGWPLDPSQWNSFMDDDDGPNDAEMNLADDVVRDPQNDLEDFSNHIAYQFDLHPFLDDTSGDGLSDMFSLYWGVTDWSGSGVPKHAEDRIKELLGDQDNNDDWDWIESQAGSLASDMPGEFTDRPTRAVLNPKPSQGTGGPVGPGDDLMDLFFDREKGTWVPEIPAIGQSVPDDCLKEENPDTRTGWLASEGPRREIDFGIMDDPGIPPRSVKEDEAEVGPSAACWRWVAYPLTKDASHGTSPWLHDSDGDRLPDAWEFHYNQTEGLTDSESKGSGDTGCQDPDRVAGLPDPNDLPPIPGLGPRHGGSHPYCLTNLESYALALDPIDGDTDGGGLPDWIEIALGLDPLDPNDDRGEEDWSGDGIPNAVKDELGLNRFFPDSAPDGLLDGDWLGGNGEWIKVRLQELKEELGENEVDLHQIYPFIDRNHGDGNLCLRKGPDLVPNMKHRPSFLGPDDPGGNLTHTQRYEWFVSRGILHDPSPDDVCPAPVEIENETYPYALFKRSVLLDTSKNPPQILGAGGGRGGWSDPSKWDTTDNAIPDGWFVYWRDRAGLEQPLCGEPGDTVRSSLDPTASDAHTEDPTQTLRHLAKYQAGQPADWDEARDGPWWGGLDPTCRDTDGDLEWFASTFDGLDDADRNWDGTGIDASVQPMPGLGPLDQIAVHWDAEEDRYVTNYTRLWENLEQRSSAFSFDQDGDGVPDFLDRARVKVLVDVDDGNNGVDLPDSLTKSDDGSSETFTVTGRVILAESPTNESYVARPGQEDPAPPESGVHGATVRLVLSDGSGSDATEAVLGFALTQADGNFTINATNSDELAITPVTEDDGTLAPRNFTLSGRRFQKGEDTTIDSGIDFLNPGPATIHLVVEPNDPSVQNVTFRDDDGQDYNVTEAYKDVGEDAGDDRFRIPRSTDDPAAPAGPVMRAALLRTDDDGEPRANTTAKHVSHHTNAVFFGTSPAFVLDLQATASLDLLVPSGLRVGEDLVATGTLSDEQGVPLPGPDRSVNVSLLDEEQGIVISTQEKELDSNDGSYEVTFNTTDLGPGTYRIEAEATLREDDDFLKAPDSKSTTLVLARDTTWSELRFNGASLFEGDAVTLPVEDGVQVEARLLDVGTGQPVTGNDVQLRVESLADRTERIVDNHTSEDDGVVTFPSKPLPKKLPLGPLRVEITAGSVTPQDRVAEAMFFLEPVFKTQIETEPVQVRTGETGDLEGRLVRLDEGPVGPGPGVIHVTGPGVDTEIEMLGDTGGRFSVPVQSDDPGVQTYSLRFVSTNKFLADSPVHDGQSTHVAGTKIETESATTIRGELVEVAGRLLLPDDRPVSGTLEVRWADQDDDSDDEEDEPDWIDVTANHAGGWSTQLPERFTAGTHPFEVRFNGTDVLDASQAIGEADVLTATHVDFINQTLRGGPAGTTGHAVAILTDQDGQPLSGRTLEGTLSGPDETRQRIEGTTDSQGTVRIRLGDLEDPHPGNWSWTMSYPGSALHAGIENQTLFQVHIERAITIDRVSARANPGEEVLVEGRIEALPRDQGPTSLQLFLEDTTVGRTTVRAGATWSLPVTVPLDIEPGPVRLSALGEESERITVTPAHANVTVTGGALIRIEEVENPDGSRRINIELTHSSAQNEPVEITLVRRAEDGSILGVHSVTTDQQGMAVLHLDPNQHGQVSAIHLNDPLLSLEESSFIQRLATLPSGSGTNWALWIIAASVLLAGVVAAAYVVWIRRRRDEIHQMFEDARNELLDPNADTRTIVVRTYNQILRLLERSGYQATDQHTVRDILSDVRKAFWLPFEPMAEASGLFEQAVYSNAPMDEGHRKTALGSFFTLSRAIDKEASD